MRGPWGDGSLSLRAPALPVELQGLSGAQRAALAAGYRGFLGAAGPGALRWAVRRLPCRPRRRAGALARAGQHAPRIFRRGAGFGVAGVDFSAWIAGERGVIGVHREADLAKPIVFENLLRIVSAFRAPLLGGVVLHSAGLVVDGRAWLFCGRSGAGKTTLSRKAHAAGAVVLSDDINLLLPGPDGRAHAHAVPFTGEFGRTLEAPARRSWPVAGLVLLEQGPRLEGFGLSRPQALARLFVGAPFVNVDRHAGPLAMDRIGRWLDRLPVTGLRCRREDPFEDILAVVEEGVEAAA